MRAVAAAFVIPFALLGAGAIAERPVALEPEWPETRREARATESTPARSARVALQSLPATPPHADSEVSSVPLVALPLAPASLPRPAESTRALTAGLFLLPDGDAPDFERWFAGTDAEELVRCRHRAQRLVARGAPQDLAAAELATVQRELAWLTDTVARLAAPARPLDGLTLLVASDVHEIDARYARLSDEDVALELWRVERAIESERKRLSEAFFALGFHEASTALG
jgi:hypothetical protein